METSYLRVEEIIRSSRDKTFFHSAECFLSFGKSRWSRNLEATTHGSHSPLTLFDTRAFSSSMSQTYIIILKINQMGSRTVFIWTCLVNIRAINHSLYICIWHKNIKEISRWLACMHIIAFISHVIYQTS